MTNSWFSRDVTAAIFVLLNKEMGAMIMFLPNPLEIEFSCKLFAFVLIEMHESWSL